MTMTIQAFALKTGLPPTTLRFYENKLLLVPEIRGDNGYRYYTEEQVPLARLIASFRHADVSIEEIRSFIQASPSEKNELLERWRRNVEDKLQSLQIAKQYLNGVGPEQSSVQLVKWEEPSVMIWFSHTLTQSRHPYQEPIDSDREELMKARLLTQPGAFVRVLAAKGDRLQVEIGFRLLTGSASIQEGQLPLVENCRIEHYQPTHFVTLECKTNDRLRCIQYTKMLDKYGFEPVGPKWDWYETGDAPIYYAYIPVIQKT
jgi:DNA-binding transcriptional MerR regulator